MTHKHLHWETVDSKIILEDKWIKLREDSCRMPDGTPVEPYYVLEYPDWVNVMALTPDNNVVMIRQYRHGAARTDLEFPAGSVEENETPEETARRELLEETGYTAEGFIKLNSNSPNPANHTNYSHSFIASNAVRKHPPALDETEQIETVLVPADELLRYAMEGKIPQAMHLATVFFGLLHLGMLKTAQKPL